MNEHRTPSLAGSSGKDSPSLTGWGIAATSGQQEYAMKSWEVLKQTTEFTCLGASVPDRSAASFRESMGHFILDEVYGLWGEPEDRHDGHTAESMAVAIGQRVNALGHLCNSQEMQSPIEEMLLGSLVWVDMNWGGFPHACNYRSPKEQLAHAGPRESIEFWICPQGSVAGYKADFLLWFSFRKVIAGVAVECDGHAFHEKTKDQAARDKKRDREIFAAGFPVIRFSGSEIFKSPHDCAMQVRELLGDALDRVSREAGYY